MKGDNTWFSLVALMVVLSLGISGITLFALYSAALNNELAVLAEAARLQAKRIEALAASNSDQAKLVAEIQEALRHVARRGSSTELQILCLNGEEVVFLLVSRGGDEQPQALPQPLSVRDQRLSPLARRAIEGRNGSAVLPDHRGVSVAAGYAPVAGLGWGVVVKLDVAELRQPFVQAGVASAVATLLLTAVGSLIFLRVTAAVRKRIRDAEAYNRELFECSADGLLTVDSSLVVTDVSKTLCRMTGLPRDRLVGARFPSWFAEPSQAEQGIRHAFAHEAIREDWLTLAGRDGVQIPVSLNAAAYRDSEGQVRGVLAGLRDVTKLKTTTEEIRRLNESLEQRVAERTKELEISNKDLEAFTYSVSHDLRAPLRHIDGFSKILAQKLAGSDPETIHFLDRIRSAVQQMGALVDDLLNLSRIGRQQLRVQATSLNSLVSEVVAQMKGETEGREIEWKIDELPFAECDPALIRQVFQNLLSNAVKFTRPRKRAVIEVGRDDSNGSRALFVRDNGVGFSMKYADKLFAVFQRLHRAEDFEGTGVGLATVHRIVSKHGGRVWASSELDQGTTFYFTLPGGVATNHTNSETEMSNGR